MTEEKMLTVSQVTNRLKTRGMKVSDRTVRRYCLRGELRFVKGPFDNSHYSIFESSVIEFEQKYLS